jgi:tetratricopeptide (TPR) repeat protein
MTISIALIAQNAHATRQQVVSCLARRGLIFRRADDVVDESIAESVAREIAGDLTPDMAASLAEMEAAHRRLRRSEFDSELLETVRKNGEKWAGLPSLEQRLKACYVRAEVLDYFGDYDAAAAAVSSVGKAQLQPLNDVIRDGWPARDVKEMLVIKRRIWVGLAYGAVFYRQGDYQAARSLLDLCDGAAVARNAPRLLGTRARLAYSRGQVYRQSQQFVDALRQFELATRLERERFREKTPEAEQASLSAPSFESVATPAFHDARLLAHAVVGKCLALGSGWIEFNSGRLSSADVLVNAGYVLLRSTGDVVHRAYAVLLIGAVKRARVGNQVDGLKRAIAIMEDADRVLSQHRIFALHSSYELLLAYAQHASYRARAYSRLGELKSNLVCGDRWQSKGEPWRSKREARWYSQVAIVESRLRRLDAEPDLQRSEEAAAAALRAAAFTQLPAAIAEAELAMGEVRLAQRNPQQAANRFEKAVAHATHNPKIVAAAYLHWARALCLAGSFEQAHVARAQADSWIHQVEHGFIQDLASSVDSELQKAGLLVEDLRKRITDAVRANRTVDKNGLLDAIEWQLLQHAKTDAPEPHRVLGLGKRQFRRRYARLRAKFSAGH